MSLSALLASAALALAACGGGSDSANTPSIQTAASAQPLPDCGDSTCKDASPLLLRHQKVGCLACGGNPTPTPSPTPAPAPFNGGLVVNGSFEPDMTGWSNWGNASVVTGGSDGSHMLQVGPAAGGAGQQVPASAGLSYHLTAQLKADAGDSITVGVAFLDGNGNNLGANKWAVSSGTGFAAVVVDAVAPAGTAMAQPYVYKNAGIGYGYVDAVAMTSGTAAVTPPPVTTPPITTTGGVPNITVGSHVNEWLQTGPDAAGAAYWVAEDPWGVQGLTAGTYGGLTGSTYELASGYSTDASQGAAARFTWKMPNGTTEVKAYPSILYGNKPGEANSWTTPAGWNVVLPGGGVSQTFPSGPVPGDSVFPAQLPLPPIYSSFNYANTGGMPTGMGHLSYDIWLQDTSVQQGSFGPHITHEIMIPLEYWGNYGAYGPGGRNPAWYDHDAVIDGRLWHIYIAKDASGNFIPFGSGWKFVVFEPDGQVAAGTLNLAAFANYLTTQTTPNGTKWAQGNEWMVSSELGIEPVYGVGDVTIYNYRIWK